MSTVTISHIRALEILDSRGNPTVEAEVVLSDGSRGRAAVPSGASTGVREAVELRDGDKSRFAGKGVQIAVSNVNTEIAKKLHDANPFDQLAIDKAMIDLDGTDNKSRLGANAILSVSMATARAAANSRNLPLYQYLGSEKSTTLPIPYFNILNGGAHANNSIDVQEFMIVPLGVSNFSEGLQAGVEIYHTLRQLLNKRGYSTAVGDEGGFAPNLNSNEHALHIICEAVERAGFEPGKEIGIALDVASSEFRKNDRYFLASEDIDLTADELIDYLESWVDRFPIVSIEDGMAEQDWDGWRSLSARLGKRVQLVGDDIFVTNPAILTEGIEQSIGNAILIKLNQVGTVTETLETVRIAQTAGYGIMISHRSGETEDSTIADLSVATAASQIKTGAPCRSERTAKYNRLLQIEAQLGGGAIYPHWQSIVRG